MDINPQEIQSIRSILHLIYHRNKNQHQKAKWWKYLSMLKRSVSSLAQTSNSKTEVKASSKSKNKINSNATQIQYLHTNLIPKCYQAFSTVVADNQFSTLGVVLMAVLARLAKSTGMRYPKAQAQAKKNLNSNSNLNSNPVATKQTSLQSKPVVDLGEKILRDGGENPHKPEAQLEAQSGSGSENALKKTTLKKQKKSKLKQRASDEPDAEEEAGASKSVESEEVKVKEKSKNKKSKSKKKKDAIDDLFSGLF